MYNELSFRARSASARQRQSPYPIISLSEAYSLIFDNTHVLETFKMKVEEEIVGYILAEDVFSEEALPSTETTNMDGYAVRGE